MIYKRFLNLICVFSLIIGFVGGVAHAGDFKSSDNDEFLAAKHNITFSIPGFTPINGVLQIAEQNPRCSIGRCGTISVDDGCSTVCSPGQQAVCHCEKCDWWGGSCSVCKCQ